MPLSSSEYTLQYWAPNNLLNPTKVSHSIAASGNVMEVIGWSLPVVHRILPYLSLEGRLFAPVGPGQPLVAVDPTVQRQRGDDVAPVEETRELMIVEYDEGEES